MCDFHSILGVSLPGNKYEIRHLPSNSHSEMAGDLKNGPNRKPVIFEAEWNGLGEIPKPEKLIRNYDECPPKLVEKIVQHYQALSGALKDGKGCEVGGYFADIEKWYDVWSAILKAGVCLQVPAVAPNVSCATQKAGNVSTQTAGARSTQTAGARSTQKAGYCSTQTAGARSTQKAGNDSTQTAGHESTQTAGDFSTQKAGDGTVQVCRWYDNGWKVKARVITEAEANRWYRFESGDWRLCTEAEIAEAEQKTTRKGKT